METNRKYNGNGEETKRKRSGDEEATNWKHISVLSPLCLHFVASSQTFEIRLRGIASVFQTGREPSERQNFQHDSRRARSMPLRSSHTRWRLKAAKIIPVQRQSIQSLNSQFPYISPIICFFKTSKLAQLVVENNSLGGGSTPSRLNAALMLPAAGIVGYISRFK